MTVYLNRRVPLANGRGTALVHVCDYELVMQYPWHLHPAERTVYAQRTYRTPDGKDHGQFMHHLVTGQKNVDHKNFDGLDNRRSNLRLANDSESLAHRRKMKNNTSGYIGVSLNKRNRKWQARIWKNGKTAWSAYFDDPVEAAHARDAKALEIYGEFAVLNFP